MTDMREKVAQAIAQADEQNGGPPYELRVKNKHSREMLFDEAKAAIEAYRDPTDAMLRAAHEAVRYEESLSGDWRDWAGSNTKRHQAMADAALEGEE
ncbi:MAG: hypothetical protein V3S55_06525 [Nitrospiraceae bacterium]